jgi:aspartate/methionine/tyrosine aminotransferase
MPTGANATPELFERLVAFGKKHNILICHDNPYSFILNPTPMSIMATPGAKDVCLEINSMSKCFNMPGWRIGVVVAQPQFIQWILKIKSNMDSGMFKPMQLAAVTALNAPQEWYDQLTDIYKRRRVIANRILEAIGATVDKNQVGMFAWGRLKSCDTPEGEIASKIVSDKILYEAKVFITPGLIFGDEGNNYMRVSLCCKEETLQEALERIQKIF